MTGPEGAALLITLCLVSGALHVAFDVPWNLLAAFNAAAAVLIGASAYY
jgi:hypothetical protein